MIWCYLITVQKHQEDHRRHKKEGQDISSWIYRKEKGTVVQERILDLQIHDSEVLEKMIFSTFLPHSHLCKRKKKNICVPELLLMAEFMKSVNESNTYWWGIEWRSYPGSMVPPAVHNGCGFYRGHLKGKQWLSLGLEWFCHFPDAYWYYQVSEHWIKIYVTDDFSFPI